MTKLDPDVLLVRDAEGAVLFDTRNATLWRMRAAALPLLERLMTPPEGGDAGPTQARDPSAAEGQFISALAARGLLAGSARRDDPPAHPWIERCDVDDGFFSTAIPGKEEPGGG